MLVIAGRAAASAIAAENLFRAQAIENEAKPSTAIDFDIYATSHDTATLEDLFEEPAPEPDTGSSRRPDSESNGDGDK